MEDPTPKIVIVRDSWNDAGSAAANAPGGDDSNEYTRVMADDDPRRRIEKITR